MSATERLRTFLAVYRAGSVTIGARSRQISQPAASQQLAALERAMGAPLFARGPGGVEPTARGRELYAMVAPSIDRLEPLLSELDGGRVGAGASPVRIGTTAEYFSARVLPALVDTTSAVSAEFGDAEEVVRMLGTGEVDIALTPLPPSRRQVSATAVGEETFSLVLAPSLAPRRLPRTLDAAGDWLTGRPWVAYSHELPVTRRFWQRALGRPFAADLRLVAPDLRVVANAVAAGLGASLLPTYVVDDLVARGALRELIPVTDVVPSQPWFASTLALDGLRDEVTAVLATLQGR
jgi:DNA-binding transcriptional LysR family regulator